MNRKTAVLLTVLFFAFLSDTRASDTTLPKRPLYITVSVGNTNSTVYGSLTDRNEQFDETVQQRNRQGFALTVHLHQQFSDQFYFKTGLGYIKKQVNPQEHSGVYYKDRLNTGYLSIPLALGVNLLPTGNGKFDLGLEFGAAANFRLVDNSYFGPDRVSAGTKPVTISLNPGASLTCILDPRIRLNLRYTYMHDITASYVQHLYWSSKEPNKKFVYKYKSHSYSLGLQWALKYCRHQGTGI